MEFDILLDWIVLTDPDRNIVSEHAVTKYVEGVKI
jgi:hypothetical protein